MIARITQVIGALMDRLGLEDFRFSVGEAKRVMLLLVVCVITSLLVVDYAEAPSEPLKVGDVASHTVKAPYPIQFVDELSHEQAREQASDAVLPVFVYQADLGGELARRVNIAFEAGRVRLEEVSVPPEDDEAPNELDETTTKAVVVSFQDALGVHVPDANVHTLLDHQFSKSSETAAVALLARAMDNRVLRDRDSLPADRGGVRIITLRDSNQTEEILTELEALLVPVEAREKVGYGVLEMHGDEDVISAAANIAKALIRPNLSFDPLQTEDRRQEAMASVEPLLVTVKQGATLFQDGDTLNESQIQMYNALQDYKGDSDVGMEIVAVSLMLALMLMSLYAFGSAHLGAFSTANRDVAAVGLLLVLTTALARMMVSVGPQVAAAVSYDAEARSVWFAVPVAGATMLVRQLLGIGWTWIFAVAASIVCGLVMDFEVLPVLFFLVSSVAAASAVEHARERISVLKAGFYVGLVNAVCVLIIHFVMLFMADGELSSAARMRPVWSMAFAMFGGMFSAFMVLGLVPAFEAAGFVTDFRLMELANLNHPLLRELMLRAPGSYHHSVIVGTLAEAGCEAIGANSLRAKVASYFHDIGKAAKPRYFVENQRDGVNRHDGLDPHTSARIIISHVTEGGRMALEHKLPKPIVENIYMHHGTGILQYFYSEAKARAEDPDSVLESDFRYPGPKPSSREAGVVMLADKVEAATRTIKHPNPHNVQAMITRILNSVIADGQFSECPLTLQEIHTVSDTFLSVLMGIYHQRIEYPDTADLSQMRAAKPAAEAVITLDLTPSMPPASVPKPTEADLEAELKRRLAQAAAARADEETSDVVDYESLEHLPQADNPRNRNS